MILLDRASGDGNAMYDDDATYSEDDHATLVAPERSSTEPLVGDTTDRPSNMLR